MHILFITTGAAAGLVPLPFAATPGFPAAALLQSAAVFPQQCKSVYITNIISCTSHKISVE